MAGGTDIHGVAVGVGRRHRVVVIGSGFGGLFATQALKRADVDVSLIDRTTHHLGGGGGRLTRMDWRIHHEQHHA